MAEAFFYHLERTDLEAALAPLLEKCLERGWRAIVRGGAPERLDALDSALWTYRADSFLPHGVEGRCDAARQPVLLTQRSHNPNGAAVLFLVDGAEPGDASGFERICPMFNGRDEAAVVQARLLWRALKGAGVAATYWRQDEAGRWAKQAEGKSS